MGIFHTKPPAVDNGDGRGAVRHDTPAQRGKNTGRGGRTLKASRIDNSTRKGKDKDRQPSKERKIKDTNKRNVTNKRDPRKLDRGETTIVGDSIVSRDPRGGFNIRHSDGTTEHRHTWEG